MGHTHRRQLALKKKKKQVKSPSPESRVPETSSDPPIGSGRESGRDSLSPSTYARSDRMETSTHSRPSSSGKMNISGISPEDLGKPSNKLIFTAWMRSFRTFEEALGILPLSFNLYPYILPQ